MKKLFLIAGMLMVLGIVTMAGAPYSRGDELQYEAVVSVFSGDVNNSGQVVGMWSGGATLYFNGTYEVISASATSPSINNLGQIVFGSQSINDLGQIVDEGSTPINGVSGGSTDINNAGQVVGYMVNGVQHAFLYSGGVMTDLGSFGGTSCALAINNLGQVVGWSQTSTGEMHAFLYSDGVMNDLGTLGGDFARAQDINDLGQIVGASRTSTGEMHAFLYSDGVMNDLYDLLSPDAANLISLGLGLDSAYSINDHGQITSSYYLLTPKVPEPATMLLLGLGLIGLAGIGRKFKS